MAAEASQQRVAAEFVSGAALLDAVVATRAQAWSGVHAYAPEPVPGLAEALGCRGSALGPTGLIVLLIGWFVCFGTILYATLWAYPLNVGGRPPLSWPYYMIPCLAGGALASAVAVFIGFVAKTGLPRLNHPAFDIDGFERATWNRFFLCVTTDGVHPDPGAVEHILAGLPVPPLSVRRVAPTSVGGHSTS